MIQFSADESVGCRMMPNEIQFFDPKDFIKGVLSRIRMPGIAAMQLATAPGSHVAGFVPEAKPVFRYSLATRMLKIKLLLAGAFFAVPLFNYTGTRGLLDYLFLLRLMLTKPTRVTMVKPS